MKKPGEVIQAFEEGMAKAPEWIQYLFGGDNFWDMMIVNTLQVFGLALAGWLIASWFERRHLRSMDIRELPLQRISVNTAKQVSSCEPEGCTLLIGSVVVAHDYFRTFFIAMKKVLK